MQKFIKYVFEILIPKLKNKMKKTSKLAAILLGLSLLGTPTPVNTSSNLFEKGRIEEASLECRVSEQPDIKRVYSYDEISQIIHDAYRCTPPKPDYLSPKFLKEMITSESNYDIKAKSEKGARGLMQIMPVAWNEVEKNRNYDEHVLDPRTNLEVGIMYLLLLDGKFKEKYNGWEKLTQEEKRKMVLSAYNAGISRFEKEDWQLRKMPTETQDYVTNISSRLEIGN